MALRGAMNFFLLSCLALCAEATVRGMISGYLGRGRADVLYNDTWGSIGNTNWDNEDSTVFCRSLGYSSGMAIPSSELYNSRPTIWLDNVDCKGNENSLDQCKHSGWGVTNIKKKRIASETIAGVQCFGDVVRISGGRSQGRAEIFTDGSWGAIAAGTFDDKDAQVFCSMLGFRTGSATSLTAVPFIYEELHCTGNESTIVHCPVKHSSKYAGQYTKDVAGVACIGEKVRIVGTMKRGRAEIFYENQWGTICDSPGNNDAATVFCKMLGFWTGRFPSQAVTKAEPGSPIWVQEYACTGNETTLAQCGYNNFTNVNCTHEEDIEVSCSNVRTRIMYSDVDVGRAELFFNGMWLPICSKTVTKEVANVFCRSLGFRDGTKVTSTQSSTNTIHMSNVNCNGFEDSIQQCTDIRWAQGCGQDTDALIKCTGSIAASGIQNEVMMFDGEGLGSVCAHKWDNDDANVYCRMMGYRESTISKVSWLVDISDFHFTNLDCRGEEFNIYECGYKLLTNERCPNDEIASANCTGNLVRIVGQKENEGRAEIFYNGQWGTICFDYWDDKAATVFCQMLGYKNGTDFDIYDLSLPETTGPVWLSDVTCTGNEKNILQCGHTDWEDHQCIHEYDVGVKCNIDDDEV